ncbi:Protein of unknown function [Pyronema omphalodes CBS 100304]|uniref:Uncharacterized protein n=1 Tax=Pyronema omphalodes (strain CBS 100304) TaxID=1076935 RepID=U4LHF9_PYROM|nr:Protein of unknown function [Pyronema omphalodes CBS 100304]
MNPKKDQFARNTISINNAAGQQVNTTHAASTTLLTGVAPPASTVPVTSATIPTIRLPTYRTIPNGWTKRCILNVCNLTVGLMFMEHDPMHRQYAIDTAKELCMG